MDNYLDHCIWIDPGRMSGQPCLGGTRITVNTVLELRKRGFTDNEIGNMYPDIKQGHFEAMDHYVKFFAMMLLNLQKLWEERDESSS